MPIAISTAWLVITPGLAHPLIARVEDQIGEGFGQGATGKLRQARIQPLIYCTDRRSRKAVAVQLLGNAFTAFQPQAGQYHRLR